MVKAKLKVMMAGVFAMFLALGLVTTTPAPVEAQQTGLVNVEVGDVTILENVNVGVALAVAANICDVNVNVLAVQLRSGSARCTAAADGTNVQIIRS